MRMYTTGQAERSSIRRSSAEICPPKPPKRPAMLPKSIVIDARRPASSTAPAAVSSIASDCPGIVIRMDRSKR